MNRPPPPDDRDIEDLDLTVRAQVILADLGITTAAGARGMPDAHFLAHRNANRLVLGEVRAILEGLPNPRRGFAERVRAQAPPLHRSHDLPASGRAFAERVRIAVGLPEGAALEAIARQVELICREHLDYLKQESEPKE